MSIVNSLPSLPSGWTWRMDFFGRYRDSLGPTITMSNGTGHFSYTAVHDDRPLPQVEIDADAWVRQSLEDRWTCWVGLRHLAGLPASPWTQHEPGPHP